MSGGSFLWVILDIESLEIYVPVIICIRIDNMKCWNFLKDFPMKFGMFFLISKSQDVKILGIKRTGFPILSQQKMKEHDDMLKRYKSLSSKFRIHCHFLKIRGFFSQNSCCLHVCYFCILLLFMFICIKERIIWILCVSF